MTPLERLNEGHVVALDKPLRWTSFQAVNKVKASIRNTYGIKKFKIGHAGTLDPLATGVLLVCLGRATKQIPQLQDGDKEYTGTLVLGATTPCFDLEQAIDCRYPYSHITLERLAQACRGLTGSLMQTPPAFSAVKIDGRRAYEQARIDAGQVAIKPKPVTVYSFEITDFRPGNPAQSPLQPEVVTPPDTLSHPSSRPPQLYDRPQGTVPPHLPQADFRIRCGKGTYIRSLARDLGQALGSGAFLASLRRTAVGPYDVGSALTLSQLDEHLHTLLGPPDATC